MLVSGTARQLRQMPSTRSSSLSTRVGDRALVADLAQHELNLADPAAAALAADPVTQPGPRQRPQQRLALAGPRRARRRAGSSPRLSESPPPPHAQCTPIEPRPSNSAVTTPRDCSGTEAVRPPDKHDRPGFDALASGRQRLRQPDQRRGRVAHHGAAGRGVDRPAAPEDAARTAEVDQLVRRRGRGRRATTRAAPALSATESGSRKRLGVARVHDLDGREHRLGGRQHLRDRGRGLDPLPDQERDLGLRARVDELVELQRAGRGAAACPTSAGRRPARGCPAPAA